jgi:hypothetical protein
VNRDWLSIVFTHAVNPSSYSSWTWPPRLLSCCSTIASKHATKAGQASGSPAYSQLARPPRIRGCSILKLRNANDVGGLHGNGHGRGWHVDLHFAMESRCFFGPPPCCGAVGGVIVAQPRAPFHKVWHRRWMAACPASRLLLRVYYSFIMALRQSDAVEDRFVCYRLLHRAAVARYAGLHAQLPTCVIAFMENNCLREQSQHLCGRGDLGGQTSEVHRICKYGDKAKRQFVSLR